MPLTQVKEPDNISKTQNIMKMYCQNPLSMFVRANLNNCTININLPKENS